MTLFSWHSAVFTLVFVLLAAGLITLLLSRSMYAKVKAMPFAIVYGIGVVVWLASLVYTQYVSNTFLAHRFSFTAAYVFTFGMLGLALTFPNSSLRRRTKVVLALDLAAGAIFVGLIFFTNLVLAPANFSGAKTAPFSVLGRAYLLLLVSHLVAAIVIFIRRYLKEVRNRLYFDYIVLAFILLFLIAITTNLILPLAGTVDFALLGPLSALLPFIAVVYALGITDINDVSYVVAQLLQVGVRFAVMVGLLMLGILLHHSFGMEYYSMPWIIAMGIIAAGGVTCFYLLGSVFDRHIDDMVAYSRLSPEKARIALIIGLSGAIELDRNVALVLKLIKQAVGARTAGIVLSLPKDGTFWSSGDITLQQADVSAVMDALAELPARQRSGSPLTSTRAFPLPLRQNLEARSIYAVKPFRANSGIEGLYLLGEKFSQEVFTRQDASLMKAIAEISDLSIERALFYNQIQSFNATLQKRVDDATYRLRTANKRLKSLDALKDDFISMASHQLRSPATSVHEAIQMLGQNYLTDENRKRLIELAEASSERLVNVITDMLSVARIQAGSFELTQAEADIATLVERAILEASGLAAQKDITVQFSSPPAHITAYVDRGKLNEAISNYLENAIKYSLEHQTVTITLAEHADGVHIEVRDHGIGIPKGERKNLFSKFFRASNARKEYPNGNGIGLFVVRTIAEAHGGGVYYQPFEDGSLFGLWFPQ